MLRSFLINKSYYKVFYILAVGLISFNWVNIDATDSAFTTIKNEEGISVLEHGKPVFFYQRKPKVAGGKYHFNNYLHPVYNLQGDTLTEEFPEDHFHHRGFFWAWHQIYIGEKKMGDSWTMDSISQEVASLETSLKKKEIRLNAKVLWKSFAIQNEQPFIEENTIITVHQRESQTRKIDIEISLKALVSGVKIGGSEDEKGYGGFSTRIKLPKNMVFTSENGAVTPLEGQVHAGKWMDFSALFEGRQHLESGMAILCHPTTPNYPAPWILRQNGSMQNIVFPGARRIELPTERPTILRYRIIIHNGNANSLDFQKLQSEYGKLYPEK